METKICPLFFAALDEGYDIHCQGERCAWYVPPMYAPNGKPINKGRCAVQCLGVLPDLAKKVGQL